MAHQGFDSLTIDMQHGVVDYQVAVSMLQGISTLGVVPLARVPWNDPARLMKILDAGAYGVICPMINTAQEAEALVRACKYPPRGFRSWGPVPASTRPTRRWWTPRRRSWRPASATTWSRGSTTPPRPTRSR